MKIVEIVSRLSEHGHEAAAPISVFPTNIITMWGSR
jgi:hypothetical protein